MATTLKKCFKLHKLFLAEVARSARLESEGAQVLSSLANASQRLPTLLQNDDNAEVMGVLSYSINTQALLLQKHFLALEKSRGFLAGILNDYQEVLRHLRSFTGDCVSLVDDALIEGENAVNADDEMTALTFPLQLLEWMETALAMLEHEIFRKTRLVAGLEYNDTLRLSTVAKEWSAKGANSNIDNEYVETGLQMPRAKPPTTSQADLELNTSKSKSKKKKKNKNKK
ncbi:hypothetical protein DVH05_026282 [Phytophthora capsici]|nr:hypothetical protein DVH05_026282 [Phytophthora capsici]|eukprot:jgi/Phyca11/544821/estExt2_Genewise1Plus.C_PHYCAscaffold_160068